MHLPTPFFLATQYVSPSNIYTVASKTQSSVSSLSEFLLTFNLLCLCPYVALGSTEGQAIKSLFYAIPLYLLS